MIDKWFESFMLLSRQTQPDSLGGSQVSFVDDMSFSGVVTWQSSRATTAAGHMALEEIPCLLHEFDMTLSPGDHVRRERDGAIYKVTSGTGSLHAPAFSGLHFGQVAVERVVFPC